MGKQVVPKKTMLLSVTGEGRRGITAAFTQILAKAEARLLDIEQAVTGSVLSLSFLIEIDDKKAVRQSLLDDLLFQADRFKLSLVFKITARAPKRSKGYVITCLGTSVTFSVIAELTLLLSKEGVNIQKIHTLARKRIHCVEMTVSTVKPIDPRDLTKKLLHLNTAFGVDIAIQEENLYRHPKRLVVMDMDSTLVQTEGIDELAKEAGVGEKVAAITHRAMNGEISFPEALRERVRLLKGLREEVLKRVYERTPLTPGAKELISVLKKLGYRTAVLSGGFDYFTSGLKETLGLDYAHSNQLEIKGGILTGEISGEIIDGQRKASLMEEIAKKEGITLDQVIAIGDGANDLPMITKAGLGIAFNAKPHVRQKANFSITQKNLDVILYLLGIRENALTEISRQ